MPQGMRWQILLNEERDVHAIISPGLSSGGWRQRRHRRQPAYYLACSVATEVATVAVASLALGAFSAKPMRAGRLRIPTCMGSH